MLTTFIQSSGTDPVIPATWIFWQGTVALVLFALLIASLVSIIRTKNQAPTRIALWVVFVFLLPFVGPVLWFIAGRKTSKPARPLSS
ncbi:PLD nuclease N-terminal domain-containing protein [Arthrobacter sp. TWP1-1]|uniref:PLD nuclease N-terminal domain-containing protein n=1 Tax=Arthrobacter sp. TWP1-1 TaxID=2804568 RepID=UPI003CEBCF8F